jgi:hypothetical protein
MRSITVTVVDCEKTLSQIAPHSSILAPTTAGGASIEPLTGDGGGFTIAFRISHPDVWQPLVFCYFPYIDTEWTTVAADIFRFEAACWLEWTQRMETPAEADSIARSDTAAVWAGLERDRIAGVRGSLISFRTATIEMPDGENATVPMLVRPYIPWATLRQISLDPARERAARQRLKDVLAGNAAATLSLPELRAIPEFIDHPSATARLSKEHLLSNGTHIVPTRWRSFHKDFWALGLGARQRLAPRIM